MPKNCVLGIDIGATKTLFALFDQRLRVLDEIKIKTDPGRGQNAFMSNVEDAVTKLLDEGIKNRNTIVATGVGVAGLVSLDGQEIVSSPNIPFLPQSRLRQHLTKLTRAPATLGNDCQLALLGEFHAGAAKGAKNIIGVFLGSGVGGALIIDGKLHLGIQGSAGDLGHYLIDPVASLAGSGRRGFLDEIGSRTALSSEAARLAAKQWAPHLFENAGTDVCKIRSRQLAESIDHGDKSIEDLVRSRMRTVGIVVSNFVDFLNPDLVLLGGGLVESMPKLVRQEVQRAVKDHATPDAGRAARVVVSKLKRHAVTTGAAKLALHRLRHMRSAK
jgi:glucokinase